MLQNQGRTGIPSQNRIFVNRSLNFGHIKLIGFDMDHTLAPYIHETFEALAFEATLSKFIQAGYPEELSKLKFKKGFVIRGLMVDRGRGNILKVDGHKYVKEAYHGYNILSKEERHSLYNQQRFKANNYLSIDTFFALSEVQLFIEIVDYMDKNPNKIKKSYEEVYADLRKFIDVSHQDGTIKNEVLSSPEKYIKKDKYLARTLVRLLDAGKKLFLLTNSNYQYTKGIMEYILSDAHEELTHWKDFWTYTIVGSGKPGFFVGNQPFFEVIEESGLLKIHQDKLESQRIYHGGNANKFEKLSGYMGDEILYIGDHIYGDIIQSKDSVNWRTMVIIDELEDEIQKYHDVKEYIYQINEKLDEREAIDEEAQKVRSLIAANQRKSKAIQTKNPPKKKTQNLQLSNDKLEQKLRQNIDLLKNIETEIKSLIDTKESKFHPLWGGLMKVGLERSRFAMQVFNHACIYSSQVTNLRYYSPYKKFLSYLERLPHEDID